MSKEVKLPDLGEGIEGAEVSYWIVSEGDFVNVGDDLVEMSTDKAVFNIHSPFSGTINEILVDEGDTIKVGETIAIIVDE